MAVTIVVKERLAEAASIVNRLQIIYKTGMILMGSSLQGGNVSVCAPVSAIVRS